MARALRTMICGSFVLVALEVGGGKGEEGAQPMKIQRLFSLLHSLPGMHWPVHSA